MTELAVYEPPLPALPDRVGTPGSQDFDSWVLVASEVIKLANVIFDTPFVPDGLRGSAPAVAAAVLAGREMGLGPMTSLANIDVIKGKPSQKAVLMRALIQSRGHRWQDGDVTDTRAVVRGCRKGESEWAEVTFTADQAKKAGIDLGRYPADKLYARASVRLARRKFADVIMGMPYSSEEAEDGDLEDEPMSAPATAPDNGSETAPKPRTAQRKPRQQAEPAGPAEPESPPRAPTPAPAANQPPLPGEDEFDKDRPGTATLGKGGQLTVLWTVLQSDFAFTNDEKEQARAVCEHIIGRKLVGGTTGNLSFNEASKVLDTLANWRTVAEGEDQSPRDVLIAAMAAHEAGDA